MKRMLLGIAVLLVLGAAPAWALGAHLAWNDSPNHGGAYDQPFDCTTPGTTSTLVVSVDATVPLLGVSNIHVVLRGLQAGPGVCDCFCPWGCPYPPIPAYWDLGSGCRAGGVTTLANFAGSPYSDSPTVTDPWHGTAFVAAGPWTLNTLTQPNGDTHFTSYAVDVAPPAPVDLAEGGEYYIAAFAFQNGTQHVLQACTGCCLPMLFDATVTITTGEGALVLNSGIFGFTSWQGYSYSCLQVPTRTSTWGSLKSAYR